MNFDEYQEATAETAIYPGRGEIGGLLYCALGLGEAGEIQGKVKKILRDYGGELTTTAARDIANELGDLLWYVARMADEIEFDLSNIAELNLYKLRDRAARNKIQGSGDNR